MNRDSISATTVPSAQSSWPQQSAVQCSSCHHIPTVTTVVCQLNITTLVQLGASGPEASDSHQGIPGPPCSADHNHPWGLGNGQCHPEGSYGLVAAAPDTSWWLHALTCPGDIVLMGVPILSPDVCLGGIVYPPLCMSPSPTLAPCRPSVCTCPPPPARAKVPVVPGPCPAGHLHVPQGLPLSLRMFLWLLLMLSICAHPSAGSDMP